MGRILDTVKKSLTDEEWRFAQDPNRDVITTGVVGRNANFQMIFDADEEDETLVLLLFSPIRVGIEKRLVAAEYLTRANFGLQLGNFEMDMSDGEVRYKVSVNIEGGTLSPQMIEHMIRAGVVTIDRYFPGLFSICHKNQSALEAVTEVEGPLRMSRVARVVDASSN